MKSAAANAALKALSTNDTDVTDLFTSFQFDDLLSTSLWSPAPSTGATAASSSGGEASGSALVINTTITGSGAPAGFASAAAAAVQYFEHTFTNSLTMNITFNWGPLSGGAIAQSNSFIGQFSYSSVRTALLAMNSGLVIPTTDPFPAGDTSKYELATPANMLWLTEAQATSLGLSSYNSGANTNSDGTITLNSNLSYNFDPTLGGVSGEYGAAPTLEHELSEMMGRQLGSNNGAGNGLLPTPLALFRYNSVSGEIDTSDNIADDYFSTNGGITHLRNNIGETNGDLADWGDTTSDVAGFGQTGATQFYTPVDIQTLQAVGWTVSNDDYWTAQTADWTTPADWTNGIPTSSSVVIIQQGDPGITSAATAASVEVQSGAALSVAAALTLGAGGMTLGGGVLNVTAALDFGFNIDVTGASTIDDNGNYFVNLNGVISGSSHLFLSGGGGIGISGANTAFSGGITFFGGVLALYNDDGIGSGSLLLDGQLQSAQLDLPNNETVANNIVVTGDCLLYVSTGNTATESGVIADAGVPGALTITGGGAIVLSGANTYSGGTTVDSGTTLSISAADNIGTGALTLDGGSTLDLTTAIALNNAITLNGAASLSVTTLDALNGLISGSGSLFVSGGGDLKLTDNSNSFTGGTTVSGSAIIVGSDDVLGTGSLTLEQNALAYFLFSAAAANNIVLDGANKFLENAVDDVTLSGIISDGSSAGALTVYGGGVFTLTGANTYSGGTEVLLGTTLSISADDNIGTGALTLDGGTTLDLTGAGVAYSAPISLGSGVVSVVVSFNFVAPDHFVGAVTGSGELLVSGSGELALDNNANSYSGGTTVDASRLAVYDDDVLGSGSLTLKNGAFVDWGHSTVANAISVATTDTFFVFQGNVATLNGQISDGGSAGGLFVTGGGTLVLTGDDTYSGGATIDSGSTLTISGAGKLGTGGVTLQSGATLLLGAGASPKITGTSSFAGTVSGAGTWSLGAGTATIVSSATVSVANWSLSGAGVTLGKALTYTGAFTMGAGSALTLSAGVLTLKGATTLSGGATAGTQKLSLQSGATVNGAVTIGGSAGLFNSGTLLETGQGALTFGDASGAAVAVTNLASGVWNIVNNQGVALGSAANSTFYNQGLLEKTVASGISTVAASLVSSGTLTAATGTLNLTGVNNLISGAMTGAGQIEIGGGVTSFNAGATASVAKLYVAGAGTALRVVTNLTYGGSLTETGGASISVATGDTLTVTGVSSFSGSVIGGGTLSMMGGSATVASPASLTVSNWTSSGTALTIFGVHKQFGPVSAANETITMNSQLIIGGATTLTNLKLAGTGTLQVNNTMTVSGGLTLGGSTSLINVGKATQSGGLTLGDSSGGATQFRNAGGAVWTLSDGAGVVLGNAAATAFNFGTVQKTTGTGTATFGVALANNSKLAVSSGRLDFAAAVTGTGAASILGASTLEFDAAVASGQTATFKGANGVLDLHDFGEFAGRISGFDTTNFGSADTILIGGPWAFVGFTQSTGLMTFADGATQHSVKLIGSYIAADFHHSVVGGATQVTYG